MIPRRPCSTGSRRRPHDLDWSPNRARVLAIDFLEGPGGGIVFLLPEVIEGAV